MLIEKHPLRIRCCSENCPAALVGQWVEGTLTCCDCYAVRYCSRECQRNHWKKHKTHCKEIKKCKVNLVQIAEEMNILNRFRTGESINCFEYKNAYRMYAKSLRKCASRLASRLEAENFLNQMRLSYRERFFEESSLEWDWDEYDDNDNNVRSLNLGSMITGHMDQEALNFIRSPIPLMLCNIRCHHLYVRTVI